MAFFDEMRIRCALLAQRISVRQHFLSETKSDFVRFSAQFLHFAMNLSAIMACSLLETRAGNANA
jgi:hypothetical protein